MSRIQQHSRRSQFALDAYNILAEMGTPLHYTLIAKLIYKKRDINLDEHPWWSNTYKILTKRVLDAILKHPELFERTDHPGAYFLTGKRPNVRSYSTLEELPE